MARIEGVEPDRVTDEYTARVLAAQAKTWGAPLLNHLVYARRPSIFRGARGMWAGIDGSGLIDGKLTALLNRLVAALNGCGSDRTSTLPSAASWAFRTKRSWPSPTTRGARCTARRNGPRWNTPIA
jgi:hypothetical protein